MAIAQQPSLLSPITKEDLGQLELHLPTLKVISYRGPGESGGVPASLEPITRQLGTKIHWLALSGLPDETNRVTGFDFHRPSLPKRLVELQERACLEYLWPLLHGMPEKARFDSECWRAFQQLSELLAAESQQIASRSFPTLYWLHDYQMALMAPLLSLEAGNIPCLFWHIAWPSPAVLASSPIRTELVESLLANRLLGFHTMEYATNFLNTVAETLPDALVDTLSMTVRYNKATTRLVVMPLGLDFAYWSRLAKASRPAAAAIPKKYKLANQLVLGIDRLDYSKGILEKLHGLELFLETNKDWHRRFHYVQLAQAPQSPSSDFEQYVRRVQYKVEQINDQYRSAGWEPIIWLREQLTQDELAAWYQAADVLAVTPVRDGLNLIAKEFVACRTDEQGVLVLSRQAGCADELTVGALLVDPLNASEIAQSIAKALALPFEEKHRRMLAMRHVVSWNQLHDWACGFLRKAILP